MGKYLKKKKKSNSGRWIVLIIAVILLALLIAAAVYLDRRADQNDNPGDNALSVPETNETQDIRAEIFDPDPIILDNGLEILRVDCYSGMYMEDGTNEIVSDVMMIILHNTAEQDLQLARIDIAYTDFTAEFEVTNLPAGESAVLLEKNRHSAVSQEYESIETRNVVFFREAMSLHEDQLELTGSNGVIQVTNISGQDITGDIYIYYKNSASDLYYGGITYRVKAADGLAAGETMKIAAGHYSPDSCKFLMVTCGE